jgi:hypothetical protein
MESNHIWPIFTILTSSQWEGIPNTLNYIRRSQKLNEHKLKYFADWIVKNMIHVFVLCIHKLYI